MADIQINGTSLIPQPRTADWEPNIVGPLLNGTDGLGSYDILVLKAPPAQGGTANFNWDSFENSVLTSVQAFPKGQSQKTGTETIYSSGVVSGPIKVMSKPGDIIETEMRIKVVT